MTKSQEQSLAGVWAQKYVDDLLSYAWDSTPEATVDQDKLAETVLDTLRFASAQAWSKTEALLSAEVRRHRLNRDWINPWQIAEDSRVLFVQATESYRTHLSPQQFATQIAFTCGQIRQRYTAEDPRILGFMSMQFHYTGQLLLPHLASEHHPLFQAYLKVMDDQLYMPLQRAYEAAAVRDYSDPVLGMVRELLPLTTPIAYRICEQVAQEYRDHQCYSGSLGQPQVRISSIRDVEMFQVYLCVCALEGSIEPLQQELFPLCVMLYPPLQVSWELIRRMLQLMTDLYTQYLPAEAASLITPFLQDLREMFVAVGLS